MKKHTHSHSHNGGVQTTAEPDGRATEHGARPKAGNRSHSGQTLAAATGRPLQTLAIVVGIGALLGFIAGRRGSRKVS